MCVTVRVFTHVMLSKAIKLY